MSDLHDYFLPLDDKLKEKQLLEQLLGICLDFSSGKVREGAFLKYASSQDLKDMIAEELPQKGDGIEKMIETLNALKMERVEDPVKRMRELGVIFNFIDLSGKEIIKSNDQSDVVST
jgi:hypothetical protein